MHRVWPIVLTSAFLATGCSRLAEMGANPPTTTTIAPWLTDPDAEQWITLEARCNAANDAEVADAERLLPLQLDADVAPEQLAEFYRRHADRVDALVEEFRDSSVPSDVADEWEVALDGLVEHAARARSIADTVQAEGLEADQTPHPGLEQFRTLMPYGACHDLLDVN